MKSIKLRLIVMNFLQFFIWGAWLCTLGLYMTTPTEEGGLAFDGALVGSVFALSGIASLIMPALIGIVSVQRAVCKLLCLVCSTEGICNTIAVFQIRVCTYVPYVFAQPGSRSYIFIQIGYFRGYRRGLFFVLTAEKSGYLAHHIVDSH